MISKVGQIMVYVNDQDAARDFWTEKVGFQVIAEEDNGQGMRWIEVAPSKDAQTSIVLHNKEFVAKMEPELNLGTPSLLFLRKISNNCTATYPINRSKSERLSAFLPAESSTLPTAKTIILLCWKRNRRQIHTYTKTAVRFRAAVFANWRMVAA